MTPTTTRVTAAADATDAADLAALRTTVQARYGEAARRVTEGQMGAACCGPATGSSGCCGATTDGWDPITANLYDEGQAAGVPAEALLASLGCGNPTALADLREGEVVLDLGSGGGIDVLLSAKRVGPTGKAYGLDMTDDMLELANENKARAGATNVEFLRGHIEDIPLPSKTVDVIISNCVINLSGDKRKVLAEAFRVLKPGGRFAVSDVVVRGVVPDAIKRSMELWVGCVAGALEEQEFISLLTAVGFENPSIEPTRIYRAEDAAAFLTNTGLDAEQFAKDIDGRFMGAFVRATKPGAAPVRKPLEMAAAASTGGGACCAPGCCSPTLEDELMTEQLATPTLRLATRADEPAVAALLTASSLPLDGVHEALPCFVVAEHAGAIVGVAGIEACGVAGEHALLRSVAVAPTWRGRGLGRVLVTRAIAEAEARGTNALYLLTTTAEHYFPSFGFATTSRDAVPDDVRATAEFQGACPASATVMMLALRQ